MYFYPSLTRYVEDPQFIKTQRPMGQAEQKARLIPFFFHTFDSGLI